MWRKLQANQIEGEGLKLKLRVKSSVGPLYVSFRLHCSAEEGETDLELQRRKIDSCVIFPPSKLWETMKSA